MWFLKLVLVQQVKEQLVLGLLYN
jgi:hypothetical protein